MCRFDADILDVYGYMSKRPRPPAARNYSAVLAKKSQLVGWIVSHCRTHSRREDYVRALQRHLHVDVYGDCGPFKCDRQRDNDCFDRISRTYKFYLALENAICRDYVTEKMFRYAEADLVLVVRGGARYEVNFGFWVGGGGGWGWGVGGVGGEVVWEGGGVSLCVPAHAER